MDPNTALVLLAREAGYIGTTTASKRLNVTATQLLALRRRMIEQALGVSVLPMLAKTSHQERRGA